MASLRCWHGLAWRPVGGVVKAATLGFGQLGGLAILFYLVLLVRDKIIVHMSHSERMFTRSCFVPISHVLTLESRQDIWVLEYPVQRH